MFQWLIAYGATALLFVTLDFVWLTTVGQTVYRPALKGLFADEIRFAPAIAFYLLYPAGVVVLAALPGARAHSVLTAAGLGSALGLIAYATYDLTNMATLRLWPLRVALIDMAWGTFLTACAAALGCFAAMRMAPAS